MSNVMTAGAGVSALVPTTLEDAQSMCSILANSQLMPPDLQNKPGNVFVVLQTGAELGIPPMQAIRGIHVVKGRAVLSADLMAALVMRSDVCEWWQCVSEDETQATFETKRVKVPASTRLTFSMTDAKRAGLTGGNWAKYPRNMLRARCITNLARLVYPDVVLGIYSPDEAAEFDRPAAGPVYATPVESRAHEDAGGIIDVEAVELQADPRADLATAIRNSGLTGQQVSDYLEAHGRGRLADIPEAQAPAALAWFKGPGKAQVAAWLSKRHAERSAPPPARLPNAAKLVDALAEATGEHVDTVRLDVWLASNGVTAGLAGLGDHAAGQVFEYIVNGVRPHWVHEPWAADEADGDKGVAR